MTDELRDKALEYHRNPAPGKLCIEATTPLATQQDLALAYSPGVAVPCNEIEADPLKAADYTARGNLVGVISNGSAVLGLGNIGPLASKPVMEGKAVLFKKFANIDVFDIEIAESDPMLLAHTIERLEPTFGGINLEDIKAPDCFIVEEYLRERLHIPVFHDDQHGTAIVVAAAMMSALEVAGKRLEEVKLVASGAGAAALACLDLLVSMGLDRKKVIVTDLNGVVHAGREEGMDPWKARFAADTPHRSLAEAIAGADVFLGLSAADVLKPEMLATMAERPIVFALANPNPEITPDRAHAVRDDVIIATGRSDYPNQVNNVLCFPFLFRGALDVGATEINQAMKIACVKAISRLARAGSGSDIVSSAYAGETLRFGPEYLIPKPFDPRLIVEIASAVAQAAMDSGVASRPIEDMEAYRHRLNSFVYRSGMIMKPVFDRARGSGCRVVFAEGENPRVLQAAQNLAREGMAYPMLLGRPDIIKQQLRELALDLREDEEFEILYDIDEERYAEAYYQQMKRRGVTRDEARSLIRSNHTLQAAMMVRLGDADTLICGSIGRFDQHLDHMLAVSGQHSREGVAALNVHILKSGPLFICDTQVNPRPDAEDILRMTLAASLEVERFGLKPKVALLSHSNFGNREGKSVRVMQKALERIRECAPELEIDGEMQADAALNELKRLERFPDSTLTGQANLLVMPGLDAGNITANVLKSLGGGITIGPILMGCDLPGHILTPSVTVRGLVNMAAVAVAQQVQLRE